MGQVNRSSCRKKKRVGYWQEASLCQLHGWLQQWKATTNDTRPWHWRCSRWKRLSKFLFYCTDHSRQANTQPRSLHVDQLRAEVGCSTDLETNHSENQQYRKVPPQPRNVHPTASKPASTPKVPQAAALWAQQNAAANVCTQNIFVDSEMTRSTSRQRDSADLDDAVYTSDEPETGTVSNRSWNKTATCS